MRIFCVSAATACASQAKFAAETHGAVYSQVDMSKAGVYRKRQTAEGRWYGASLLGVGAGSMTYHCSRGRWRAAGRKIDYWAISAASAALVGGSISALVQALLIFCTSSCA